MRPILYVEGELIFPDGRTRRASWWERVKWRLGILHNPQF